MAALQPPPGSRPATTTVVPHRQLDQQPADERYVAAVLAEALSRPGLVAGEQGPGAGHRVHLALPLVLVRAAEEAD